MVASPRFFVEYSTRTTLGQSETYVDVPTSATIDQFLEMVCRTRGEM